MPVAVTLLALVSVAAEPAWQPATPQKLPRWRGFNLLEKFHLDWSNGPFLEEDFRNIADLGFDFVRLPMDYRTWIVDGDWERFDEAVLREIDQAIAKMPEINEFLVQGIEEKFPIEETYKRMGEIAGVPIPEEELGVEALSLQARANT